MLSNPVKDTFLVLLILDTLRQSTRRSHKNLPPFYMSTGASAILGCRNPLFQVPSFCLSICSKVLLSCFKTALCPNPKCCLPGSSVPLCRTTWRAWWLPRPYNKAVSLGISGSTRLFTCSLLALSDWRRSITHRETPINLENNLLGKSDLHQL